MRISDWSSDVCSSDLHQVERLVGRLARDRRHLPGREGQADGQDIACCAQQGKAAVIKAAAVAEAVARRIEGLQRRQRILRTVAEFFDEATDLDIVGMAFAVAQEAIESRQIGRASCRERVCQYV